MPLCQVVDESTVCLMGHERRQTLALIEDLSCQVYVPTYFCEDQRPGSGYCSPSSNSSAPSQCGSTYGSSSSSTSSSSSGSSGQYSPMSTSSTCSPSLSPKPQPEVQHDRPPPPVMAPPPPHKFSVPPPSLPPPGPPPAVATCQTTTAPCQPPPVSHCQPQPPLSTPPCQPAPCQPPVSLPSQPQPPQGCVSHQQSIPTYEIVTSCQPTVMYSNGYYYTSFVPPTNSGTSSNFINTTTVTQTLPVPGTTPCFSCTCSCQGPPGGITAPPPTWHQVAHVPQVAPPQPGS